MQKLSISLGHLFFFFFFCFFERVLGEQPPPDVKVLSAGEPPTSSHRRLPYTREMKPVIYIKKIAAKKNDNQHLYQQKMSFKHAVEKNIPCTEQSCTDSRGT